VKSSICILFPFLGLHVSSIKIKCFPQYLCLDQRHPNYGPPRCFMPLAVLFIRNGIATAVSSMPTAVLAVLIQAEFIFE
jgi:hypothetical protein